MLGFKRKTDSYRNDSKGSFSIYMAIGFTTIIMGVGCAFDMAQVTSQKSRLQDLTDATALAAAIATRNDSQNRQTSAQNHFEENRTLSGGLVVNDNPRIDFDDAAKVVTVEVKADYKYMFMGMFGMADPTVTTVATVGYMIDDVAPLSIAFAFDASGSMDDLSPDGVKKIEALKQATTELFDEIYEASERPDLLNQKMRTAFSSYNTELVESESMMQGRNHILSAVNGMIADGGTNSTPSLQFALEQLDNQKAAIANNGWAGYVVFMTDGDNNDVDLDGNPVTWDADSYTKCDEIKAAGYRIFGVGFEAPEKGENLLRHCASSKGDYFDSSNAKDLKQAFKLIGQELGRSTIAIKS